MAQLFYIIGASGAGKDTLITYCREKINSSVPVLFAHRYITRPASSGHENHIYLSPAEFEARLHGGLFAMHWYSHQLAYGIGTEVIAWMQAGFNVVINGSREHLPEALALSPDMQVILISADQEIIRQRLYRRGREDEASIARRIERNAELNIDDPHVQLISNNGSIEDAGTALLNLLTARISAASTL